MKLAVHIFWLVLLLLFAAQAQAATKYVGKNVSGASDSHDCTNDTTQICLTIAKGISVMSGGDTLVIHAGTYNESVNATIPAGSSFDAPTTIRAASGESVTWTQTNDAYGELLISNSQYVVIGVQNGGFNFYYTGIPTSTEQHIKITDNGNHIRIQYNTFQGNAIPVLMSPGGVSGGGGYNEILYNDMSNNLGRDPYAFGTYGLYIRTSNNKIQFNTIHDTDGYGVHINASGEGDAPSYNVVANNVFYNCAQILHESAVLVGGGITGLTNQNSVHNNIFYNNYNAISVRYGSQNTYIYSNTIYNTNGEGDGVNLYYDSGPTYIKNNIIANGSGWGVNTYGTTNNTIQYNNFYANSSGTVSDGSGSNNVTSDPQFVSTTPSDPNFLKIGAVSPAKDAGAALGSAYATDFDGNLRPFGNGWDIGAYEYGSGPTPPPTPPTPALVLALPFDAGDGNTAVDVSGFHNNGSFSTGVNWDNSGKYGKALAFDGKGGVTIQPSSSLDLITGFTLEAWVNVASTSAVFRPIMIRMRPDRTDTQYSLYISSDTYLCNNGWAFSQTNNLGGAYYNDAVCDTSSFPTNQWVHLAATYGGIGTTLSLYRDGQIVSSITPPGTPVTSSGALYIGFNPYPEYFTGKLDEIRIYNYRRTQAEIQTDMETPLTPTGPTAVIKISPATSLKLSATNGALKVGQ